MMYRLKNGYGLCANCGYVLRLGFLLGSLSRVEVLDLCFEFHGKKSYVSTVSTKLPYVSTFSAKVQYISAFSTVSTDIF